MRLSRKGDDAPLGASADGAADMALGCSDSSSREYKTMERREGWLYGVNLLFKKLCLGWELRQDAVDMPVEPFRFLLKEGGIGGEV